MEDAALVILSGGQDSTLCLFLAKQQHETIHALTFDYGQRHDVEIEAAVKVAKMAGAASHEVLLLGFDILKSTSPLVSSSAVPQYASTADLPKDGEPEPTFVPGRNILFLTLAANRAVALGVNHIYLGVCQADFGGYPDCRQDFIRRMESALNMGLFGIDPDYQGSSSPHPNQIHLHTPLMHLTKAESVRRATALPGCMEALAHSHTCYKGLYPPDPHNHASLLRARGFHEAGVADPLIKRAKEDGLLPQDYPDSGLVEGTPYGLKE